MGLPFGGLSGLTTRDAGREILGVSDAQQGGRVYLFELEDPAGTLRVVTLNAVALGMAPGDEHPDPAGITLLPDGSYAVSAEGTALNRGCHRRSISMVATATSCAA